MWRCYVNGIEKNTITIGTCRLVTANLTPIIREYLQLDTEGDLDFAHISSCLQYVQVPPNLCAVEWGTAV